MHILLINPPDELDAMFGVGKGLIKKYEPLGLLYIAAVARDAGHRVSVVDAHAQELTGEQIKRIIESIRPEVVGFSTLTCSGALVHDLGKWIRTTLPMTKVVLGNVHASIFADAYLANGCCDVVVHGEGEFTFLRLLECFETRSDLSTIQSISYFDNTTGVPKTTSSSAVVSDLSKLPYPARDLVDQKFYKMSSLSNQNYISKKGETAKTIVTSRGCPFRCSFCVVHGNQKPRFNSIERVVDEMECLQNEYNTSFVYIQDPLFMGSVKRVIAICEEITRRGLTIKWGCDARVDHMSRELIEAMDRANCYELSLGIESATQRHLDAVEKKTTPAKVREAITLIRQYSDIRIEGLFILGFDTETYQEALDTIQFSLDIGIDMAQFSIMTPYPGSALFEKLSAAGAIDTGVRLDGTIDPTIWKRYSSYIIFTQNEPIWVTPSLGVDNLRKLQKKAVRSFYFRPKQFIQALGRIRPNNFIESTQIALRGFF